MHNKDRLTNAISTTYSTFGSHIPHAEHRPRCCQSRLTRTGRTPPPYSLPSACYRPSSPHFPIHFLTRKMNPISEILRDPSPNPQMVDDTGCGPTTYVASSVVCVFACVSVEPMEIRDAAWTQTRVGPKEPCIRRESRSPAGRGTFEGVHVPAR